MVKNIRKKKTKRKKIKKLMKVKEKLRNKKDVRKKCRIKDRGQKIQEREYRAENRKMKKSK